jgi:hypothetical protein
MKKHYNFISAIHYLKIFHKKPREVNGPYDKLIISSLYEWFTPRREIKPHLKSVIEKGLTSMASNIHFSILEIKPKLKNELISMLKNMQVAG